jgi:uncharacterized protein YqhQ
MEEAMGVRLYPLSSNENDMKKDITKLPKSTKILIILYRVTYSLLYFIIVPYLMVDYLYKVQAHDSFVEIGMGVLGLTLLGYFIWIWLLEKLSDFYLKNNYGK